MRNVSGLAAISSEEFLHNLSDSGLFSAEELRKVQTELPGAAPTGDTAVLIQHLIATGKLTRFQADAVCDRRFEELLLGNYEVLERLGAGAMGTVYKARHRRMKRVVALKVLSRAACQSPIFLQRFQREVEVISRLTHPNIVMAF